MKLIRFGEPGKEKPGLLLSDGSRVNASGFGSDYNESFFESDGIAALRKWFDANGSSAPRVESSVRLGPPICRPSKIICVGANFHQHAIESGLEIPKEPVIFFKSTTSLVGPNDNVIIPRNAEKVDWEVELAVVIGKKASYIAEGRRLRIHGGVRPAQRLLRAKFPARTQRSMGQREERGHFRAARAISRDSRRDS